MAKKKVAKKKVSRRAAPKEMKAEDKVLVDAVDEMTDEEVEDIIESPDYKAASPIDEPLKKLKDNNMYDKVKIRVPISFKLKRKRYSPGVHEVERHMVPTILEIIDKKRKADISIFTGKNYLIERLLDRTLIVKESGSELDLKKMVK